MSGQRLEVLVYLEDAEHGPITRTDGHVELEQTITQVALEDVLVLGKVTDLNRLPALERGRELIAHREALAHQPSLVRVHDLARSVPEFDPHDRAPE